MNLWLLVSGYYYFNHFSSLSKAFHEVFRHFAVLDNLIRIKKGQIIEKDLYLQVNVELVLMGQIIFVCTYFGRWKRSHQFSCDLDYKSSAPI